MANKVYEIVTGRIIQKIEDAIQNGGCLPWAKPWVFANAPRNYVSGKQYRGVNNLLLDGGEYITWTQLCDLQKHNPDLKLKKGLKKEMVVYFNFSEREKEKISNTGERVTEKQKIPYLRYYSVFNISHVEGLQSKVEGQHFTHDPIEEAERVFNGYITRENLKVEFVKGDKACYSPASDRITLPMMEQYPALEEYYSTVFHEAAHSTGAAHRLNRNIRNMFGDAEYSKEELCAEMTAAMLLGHCNIQTVTAEQNNVAYMRHWLKALQDNVTLIVGASAQAQKAADYILGQGDADNECDC